jgi:hypothetical protein
MEDPHLTPESIAAQIDRIDYTGSFTVRGGPK